MSDVRTFENKFAEEIRSGKTSNQSEWDGLINITADSLIIYPVYIVDLKRKPRPFFKKRNAPIISDDKNPYYSDNTIIEIAFYLLFHFKIWILNNTNLDKREQVMIQNVTNRFLTTLKSITNGIDYIAILNSRFEIYGMTPPNQLTELLQAFITDTKVRTNITNHIKENKWQRFDLHEPDGFHLMLDNEFYTASFFKLWLLNMLPVITKKVEEKFEQLNRFYPSLPE